MSAELLQVGALAAKAQEELDRKTTLLARVASAFFEVKDGVLVYRQIDNELLAAFEVDVASPTFDGFSSIGMMIARIRESERDRDAAEVALAYAADKLAKAAAALDREIDGADHARDGEISDHPQTKSDGRRLGEALRRIREVLQ